MGKRIFTDDELKALRTIPRNMGGKANSLSIDANKASFIYDPNSKKLVTVPIQVTIAPVARNKARLTLYGEHYRLVKNKLVKREGAYIVQDIDLLEKDMIYSLSQALGKISEAMRNLRWAIDLKSLGGTWTC
jgi:hypothetical protein